jgi:lipopolysaccharide assembly protein A
MSRIVKLSIFLFVLLLGLIFHLRNDQTVLIDYYIGTLELPFSFVPVFTLSIGVILGVVASIPARIKLKSENARLLKQLNVTEKEITALRVMPIKDSL